MFLKVVPVRDPTSLRVDKIWIFKWPWTTKYSASFGRKPLGRQAIGQNSVLVDITLNTCRPNDFRQKRFWTNDQYQLNINIKVSIVIAQPKPTQSVCLLRTKLSYQGSRTQKVGGGWGQSAPPMILLGLLDRGTP